MMLSIEDVASEMWDHEEMMRTEQGGGLPPGFRFHPTDEELITFYLASKVFHGSFCTGVDIAEVDLNRCEPWDLPEEAKMGEREWYLFSLRDRKYPTGVRTNRATGAGYWKATGKDRQVFSNNGGGAQVLGLKKTLVFYKGRAPRGEKTKWVMHEYRLHSHSSHRHTHLSALEEEWVICRIFHKAAVDKKYHPLLLQQQGHSRLMMQTCSSQTATATATAAAPSVPLPASLDATALCQPHHNPFQNHQENNKTLINKTHSQLSILSSLNNGLQEEQQEQQSYDLTALTSNLLIGNTMSIGEEETTQSNSMLFKSLLPHQDSIWDCLKEHSGTSIAKQRKTEPDFFHHNLPDAATIQNWLDYNITTHNPYQSQPFTFHNMDSSCAAIRFSAPDDTTAHQEMSASSSSLPFNRSAASHMMMLDF